MTERFLGRLARFVDDGDAALLAEGRIGQDDVVFAVLRRRARPCVTTGRVLFESAADAVQQQVHRAEARDAVHQLDAEERAVLELLLLRSIELVMLGDVIMRREQESARAAGRIADGLSRLRGDHVHHRGDERARREVLSRAAFHVLGVLLQQAFVGVAFHVGAQAEIHCSLSIRSTMRRRSLAGSWILFCALRKMTPSMPVRLPSSSRVWR